MPLCIICALQMAHCPSRQVKPTLGRLTSLIGNCIAHGLSWGVQISRGSNTPCTAIILAHLLVESMRPTASRMAVKQRLFVKPPGCQALVYHLWSLVGRHEWISKGTTHTDLEACLEACSTIRSV